jgi:catechol 2,3-dioxygenase-like lactoylglutathione lyase family enzyme
MSAFAGGLRRVHHAGITVADLDRSIGFWERFLGVDPRRRTVLDGPQVERLVGYAGARIERCWLDLPGGTELELVQYLGRDDDAYADGTAHPGNVHLCLVVDDMNGAHRHALACGAAPVGDGPIDVAAGPYAGGRVAYVRNPDGVTLELLQLPPEDRGDG